MIIFLLFGVDVSVLFSFVSKSSVLNFIFDVIMVANKNVKNVFKNELQIFIQNIVTRNNTKLKHFLKCF